MTRRDEFIKAALQGVMANAGVVGVNNAIVAQSIVDVVDDVMRKSDPQPVTVPFKDSTPLEYSPGLEMTSSFRAGILERVQKARARENWMPEQLIAQAREVLAGDTWENPDWKRAVEDAIEVVSYGSENSINGQAAMREYAEAHELLTRLVPRSELPGYATANGN